jgi:uncharacterized membrane protein YsdA (DUF1294 family)
LFSVLLKTSDFQAFAPDSSQFYRCFAEISLFLVANVQDRVVAKKQKMSTPEKTLNENTLQLSDSKAWLSIRLCRPKVLGSFFQVHFSIIEKKDLPRPYNF